METAQSRLSRRVMIVQKLVSTGFASVAGSRIEDARSEAGLGPAAVYQAKSRKSKIIDERIASVARRDLTSHSR